MGLGSCSCTTGIGREGHRFFQLVEFSRPQGTDFLLPKQVQVQGDDLASSLGSLKKWEQTERHKHDRTMVEAASISTSEIAGADWSAPLLRDWPLPLMGDC